MATAAGDVPHASSWLVGRILAIYDAHLLLVDATDEDRRNFAEVPPPSGRGLGRRRGRPLRAATMATAGSPSLVI